MTQRTTLMIASLLSLSFFSIHWADEIARGIEPGTLSGAGGFAILFVWVYATIVLTEKRSGLVLILLGSLMASGVPLLHMSGKGLVGGRIQPNSEGALFWVWTNVALGVSGMISSALAARALWAYRRRPSNASS